MALGLSLVVARENTERLDLVIGRAERLDLVIGRGDPLNEHLASTLKLPLGLPSLSIHTPSAPFFAHVACLPP
jgi:hypothetical protein